ncbi:MAG: GNAT family N-acetyltransferase [Halanaerobium sp.]|nr:GNAT family N-acetyltransferase [Halanaerobium sp.]
MNFQFEPIEEKHIAKAVELVLIAYQEEREELPYLPENRSFRENLPTKIANLFKDGTGIAANLNGELKGFLTGFEVDNLWGNCRGVYIPLYGHGAAREGRREVYQEMYRYCSGIWTNRACLNHAITLFAHDSIAVDTWSWLGFGLRCVDAIRKVEPVVRENDDILIRKATERDLSDLVSLSQEFAHYFAEPPIFMARGDEDYAAYHQKWLDDEEHHLWLALKEDKALGYIKIEPDGESFLSEHRSVMNITGAFVTAEYRKKGLGKTLLAAVQDWLIENQYPLCGVDFEAFNISGSNFWNSYFTPYTYSVVRRIDERILQVKT